MTLKPVGVTIFALFAWTLILSASPNALGNTSTTSVPQNRIAKPFSVTFAVARERSLYDYQDGTLQESNSYELAPSYAWSLGKTSLLLAYSEDLRAPDNNAGDIADIALNHSLKGWDFSLVKLIPSMTVISPQSKVSRNLKNLETAISLRLTAAIQEERLIPGFSLAAALSLRRNFHRYDTDLEGQPNPQYSSRQSLMVGYAFGAFSLDSEFHHINSWSYGGRLNEEFEHAEEFTFSATDSLALSLGHTNGGSVFKANGYESNYQLIDDNNSLVYARVSMQY